MQTKTAKQILLDAKQVLQERGWTQHEFMDCNGRVCVIGAVRLAFGTSAHWQPSAYAEPYFAACRALAAAVQANPGSATLDVCGFNDHEARLLPDVLEMLDEGAKLL